MTEAIMREQVREQMGIDRWKEEDQGFLENARRNVDVMRKCSGIC